MVPLVTINYFPLLFLHRMDRQYTTVKYGCRTENSSCKSRNCLSPEALAGSYWFIMLKRFGGSRV